ncbi:cation:proton antiporter [Corynebacterium flavescens]|uniref:Sodium:proton antiporter n=3 Tax=Corynebacterium flavescens TaxID=28028 RepID=A0A1L7CJG3_CORFL|nr:MULTISPECIES: sodium:proton antiporter [Corynebacterium]APT85938.1 sodium:proton antiporter [Corynebacterium flavescens]KAA8724873.1 sodium:proton antiporter [Corynebacterium flavescens]MDN6100173.1 sodium:proton antiporter [Corynebacterium flavescens]MDN6199755.1 sodium:proton antiporter [Corynebacterium flavescens]MDN6226798.1 sodium:proton antiporter [Corynebacterium flavescens]
MEVLLVLIGLMLLTVVVVAVGDKIGLPWPALLTILTAVAVFTPALPSLNVPAELILPIFLPPLLWALARRTSWGVIREQWVTILSLSVLLVVATTFAVGLTAFAFLPGLGFAGAILIGAAIAPPDPVAVEAVAEPAGIPRRIISALQTEGLFNDAASIVAFHLALMAVVNEGELTWSGAIVNFIYSAAVACILGWVAGRLAAMFITRVHEVNARNALTWVVPFAVYIFAEEIHASGVIAVVIAAVELSSRADIQAEDRLSGQSFWETIELLFTGVAFGLIGLNVSDAVAEVGADLWHSVLVGVILSFVAFLVRLVWMYVYYRINLRRGKPRVAPLRLQEVLLMTWSGMRGLVTLALVLSVPSGAFGFHHELAVIALTVLLVTMVIPGLLLPWLMSRLDLTQHSEAAADKMRMQITKQARRAGISAMQKHFSELDPEITANIAQWLEDRLGEDEDGEDASTRIQKAIRARDIALAARRIALIGAQQELLNMRRDRNYNPMIVDEILEEVDRMSLSTKH